ncbi:hypothetical protein [Jeotgalibacillus proteolyticus]|uniref:hypothetical protein n=1 Tax=Jeotgalibacillus proteolyticus TaxID=2082395 RepID=UPI003CEC991E
MKKLFSPFGVSLLFFGLVAVLSFTPYSETAQFLGLYSLVAFMVIFLHELGHVIGGRLAGYTFISLTVGPITIIKDPQLKVIPNHGWMTFGGVASCVPAEANLKNLLKGHKLYTAGGPVLTMIAFIISFMIWYVTQTEFAMLLAALNIAIFLATAIPFQGTFKSDGRVFLTLHKGGKEAETFLAELFLLKEMLTPKSPKEWDEKWIIQAQKAEATIDTTMTACLLLYTKLVKENYSKASEAITPYKQLPLTKKTKLRLQLITHIRQIDFFLSPEPDYSLIQSLHRQLSKIEPVSYGRSEAMLAFIEGDSARADLLLSGVFKKCDDGLEKYGFFEAERELTLVVRDRINKMKSLVQAK